LADKILHLIGEFQPPGQHLIQLFRFTKNLINNCHNIQKSEIIELNVAYGFY